MEDILFRMILGHLAGDYLLQSKKMALKKSEKTWTGFVWCAFHCLVYTASVCLFLWTFNPMIAALVFLSHWPFDRWSLGAIWLKLIRGRDILAAYVSREKYREIDLAFSCFVYAVVDNTIHLILLWFMVRFVL